MKFDTRFLRSKVAWRIFTLFICCSLIPIAALAMFSYRHVTDQLEAQSHRRLQQATKSHGMSIFERLLVLETALSQMAMPNGPDAPKESIPRLSENLLDMIAPRFISAVLFAEPGSAATPLFGNPEPIPTLMEDQLAAINKGDPVLDVEYLKTDQVRIWLALPTPSAVHPAAYRMGEIDIAYLMGIGFMNTLPPMTELCVMDQDGKIISSSIEGLTSDMPVDFFNRIGSSESRHLEFQLQGVNYLAGHWSLFLKSRYFGSNNAIVILAQTQEEVLAPLNKFKRMFPLVILLSVWVVSLMSFVTIRKSLVPLARLKEGTLRLAGRDFTTPVIVTSRDEFQDLADSFNSMSTELDSQFKTLTTIAEIDHAILSSLETKAIVATLLKRIHDLLSCDIVVIGLVEADKSRMELHSRDFLTEQATSRIIETDHFIRLASSRYLIIDASSEPNNPLFSLAPSSIREFLAVPILLKNLVCGIIAIGHQQEKGASTEALSRLSQLSDQVAVAVSNAELLGELKQLNWETLNALARTVDAKSPWTSGHSERVTQISMQIGKAMNLTDKNLDILHRAALLHDIGKIAVPSAILDKPGRLTQEEFEIVQQHPATGARILEPVSAYREVIPLVLQHHERFDGGGYPGGLTGDSIDAGARILSVADVYDALASDRPYRESWPKEKVMQIIKEGAGTQFDPEVVRVLIRISDDL
jgi:putative nucleotidyltransferase with HDIG domain